jgi:hypothetical protein
MADPTGSPTITEADLEGLNRRAVLRILRLAERLAVVLFVVAGLLALAWLWTVLRQQGVIDSEDGDVFSPFDGEHGLGWKARLDLFANTLFELAFAAGVLGIGLGTRAYCAVATVRAGGSLTGWELGEPIDPDPIDLDT